MLNLVANTSTEKRIFKALEAFASDKGLRIVKIQFQKVRDFDIQNDSPSIEVFTDTSLPWSARAKLLDKVKETSLEVKRDLLVRLREEDKTNLQRLANLHSTQKADDLMAILEETLSYSSSESAFVEIYHQYFQLLYNYGRQINSDPESCKDVIQDLFIKLRKNRSKLPQVNSIKAFLLKSYRNKLYSEFKKKQRIETITYSNEAHNFLVSPSYETLLIDRQITKEQLERIKSAISTLSQRQREALHFFYYNNLSYEEIGEVMNFSSVKAARNLVYRALKEVKGKRNIEIMLAFSSLPYFSKVYWFPS